MLVDTTFDFRSDTPPGRDPDAHSPTLRTYHRHLWSKPLPDGRLFELSAETPGVYLHHSSELGEFWLASDAVMASYSTYKATQEIIDRIPAVEVEAFDRLGYTMGAMMVWPGNRIDGKQTINGARGFNRSIADRMDLTLECIRRHYEGGTSALSDTLARYGDYFELFASFRGFVDHFLLNDMVDGDYERVVFFMDFDDFRPPSIPQDLNTYLEFRKRSIESIEARNRRIAAWCASDG